MSYHHYSTNLISRGVLVWAAWGLLLTLPSPAASSEETCPCTWRRQGQTLKPIGATDAELVSLKLEEDLTVQTIWFDGFDIQDTGTEVIFGNSQMNLNTVMTISPREDYTNNLILMNSRLQIGEPDRPQIFSAIHAYGALDPTISAEGSIGIRSIADERAIVAEGQEIGVWAQGATGINATGTTKALAASSLNGTGVEAISATGTNSWGGTAILIRGGGDMIRGGSLVNPAFHVNNAGDVRARHFLTQSDIEGKTDINPLTDVLPKLGQIRGISFRPSGPQAGPQERRRLGVIAQEVEEAFPELVRSWGEGDQKAVDYGGLTAVLIEAVKGLSVENEDLRTRLAALEQRVARGEASRN